jgi:release factor glutamine methyltransferase
MSTVEELLSLGARRLPRREGIPDPRREARWLLAHAWGVKESRLLLHPELEVPSAVEQRFGDWLRRRAGGEPAQHLSGGCEFRGRDYVVTPAVLVPRPETELLVQVALELPVADDARVLDLGTGSGCVAVSLAAERPRWQVIGVDRSLAALAVAAKNRARHGAELLLVCGDLGDQLAGGFDLVVANLPYLPSASLSELPVEVRHDPELALDGGSDGLELIRRLLEDLPRLLKACGGAVLELAEDQADQIAEVAVRRGLAVARRICDVGGCERVVVLQRR